MGLGFLTPEEDYKAGEVDLDAAVRIVAAAAAKSFFMAASNCWALSFSWL